MVNVTDFTKEQLKELAFSDEEKQEMARAREMPIVFDEECVEVTPERAMKFRRVNPPRNVSRLA